MASAIVSHGRMGLANRLSNPKYNMTNDYKKQCGYTEAEYKQLCDYGIKRDAPGPTRLRPQTVALAHLSIAAGHATARRGHDLACDIPTFKYPPSLLSPLALTKCTPIARSAMLGTLQHEVLSEAEGPMPCPQLIFSNTTKESKNELKHFFVMPSVYTFSCVFWAIGLSQFV